VTGGEKASSLPEKEMDEENPCLQAERKGEKRKKFYGEGIPAVRRKKMGSL